MPETDAQRIEIANLTRATLGQDQVLTPLQARAFVRAIQTTWQVETIQWSGADSVETLAQAQKLVHAGRVLSSIGGGSAGEAGLAFRRAGELFEWLARSDDETKKSVPLALFAAGSFQLGGLPAMAAGILRQITSADDGMKLFANFLAADFDRVLSQVGAFWEAHPELTTRNAGESFFRGDSEDDHAWLAIVELVRCIGLAASSLRRGDQQRFEAAQAHLLQVERFLLRLASEDIALLSFFMRAACDSYGKATIYGPLRQLAALRPDRINYMNGFARRQYARGRGMAISASRAGSSVTKFVLRPLYADGLGENAGSKPSDCEGTSSDGGGRSRSTCTLSCPFAGTRGRSRGQAHLGVRKRLHCYRFVRGSRLGHYRRMAYF